MKDYQKQCLVTEAKVTEEMVNRYNQASISIDNLLSVIQFYNEQLDILKKFVYYGKQTEETSEVIDTHGCCGECNCINNAITTMKTLDDANFIRKMHAVMGISTESSEMYEALLKEDNVNLMEEFGDVGWFSSLGLDACGYSLEETQERNINKLRARYGEKFTEYDANNRDVDKERETLEMVVTSKIS